MNQARKKKYSNIYQNILSLLLKFVLDKGYSLKEQLVTVIRNNINNQVTAVTMANFLAVEISYVEQVILLLTSYPDESDEEIAKRL